MLGGLAEGPVPRRGETHFDPPAACIVLTTFLVGVLGIVDVPPSLGWVPRP